jgi:hypothetical protein
MNTEQISDSSREDKTLQAQRINTTERIPGNEHYYEKDGLRTYGDGEDHDHEPPVLML